MPTITGFEIYEVATDFVTIDLIIWKRYRRRAPGIVEIMLDANPQLSRQHRTTPFLAVGTFIRVPIDPNLIMGLPPPALVQATAPNIWGAAGGYTL